MNIYLDQNDRLSAHNYMTNLEAALRSSVPEVNVVDSQSLADVIHLNNLNIWGRVVHGKEVRTKHFEHWLRGLTSDIPLVVTAHGDIHFTEARRLVSDRELLSRFIRASQRILSTYVDGILTASNSVKRNLNSYGIDEQKMFVVPHGVDNRYQRNSEPTEQYVLHISHYSPRKNPEAVLNIATKLEKRMVIGGAEWEEHAPNTLREDDTVQFPGYVSEERLIDLYNRASVFYFPTLHEGFGLPVLEAMQAGLPIITSDVYAIPEVVGDAAILCDPKNTARHHRAIEKLLTDADLRHNYEQKATERAEDFSWSRTATETAEVYQKIIDI